MRRPIALAMSIAVMASILSVAPALAVDKPGCPDDKPLIVDVTQGIANVDDVGVSGNVWALDTVLERIRMWQVGTNNFCVRRDDVGSFTSFAGVSPAGTGTVSGGVTGSLIGTDFLRIGGIFSPTVPTTGYIGTVDAGCNQQGQCTDTSYRVVSRYFARANSINFGWFAVTYDGGSHGTFLQSTDGNVGDITG
jgi:hypothetical protein